MKNFVVRRSDSLLVLSSWDNLSDAETALAEMLADGDINPENYEVVDIALEQELSHAEPTDFTEQELADVS